MDRAVKQPFVGHTVMENWLEDAGGAVVLVSEL